ncbi:MAG: hypothetical protein K9M03_04205 [Kiritimatiellales bacterium]|nr:hypothetical protein [Kiritimatiellales bacterium]
MSLSIPEYFPEGFREAIQPLIDYIELPRTHITSAEDAARIVRNRCDAICGYLPDEVCELLTKFVNESPSIELEHRMQDVRACKLGIMPKDQLDSAIKAAEEALTKWWVISRKIPDGLFKSAEYRELYN